MMITKRKNIKDMRGEQTTYQFLLEIMYTVRQFNSRQDILCIIVQSLSLCPVCLPAVIMKKV